jgi:hypothetical protein
MFGQGNVAVPVNAELLADIAYSTQKRAFERGFSSYCPEPREQI